jgi:hypothetical protein
VLARVLARLSVREQTRGGEWHARATQFSVCAD